MRFSAILSVKVSRRRVESGLTHALLGHPKREGLEALRAGRALGVGGEQLHDDGDAGLQVTQLERSLGAAQVLQQLQRAAVAHLWDEGGVLLNMGESGKR